MIPVSKYIIYVLPASRDQIPLRLVHRIIPLPLQTRCCKVGHSDPEFMILILIASSNCLSKGVVNDLIASILKFRVVALG